MSISIDVKGVLEATTFINNKSKLAAKKAQAGLFKSAVFLQGEVKQSIAGKRSEFKSVDTGRFLNTVDLEATKDNAAVFSKLPYARHLEHGTNFKNSPRRHFTNSADRSKAKIKDIIQSEVNTI